MRWGKRTPAALPERPTGVRIVLVDGHEIGGECRYEGLIKGQHVWLVTCPRPMSQVRRVTMERLPAQTKVIVKGDY